MPPGARALPKATRCASPTPVDHLGELRRCYNAFTYYSHTNAHINKIPFYEDQKDKLYARARALSAAQSFARKQGFIDSGRYDPFTLEDDLAWDHNLGKFADAEDGKRPWVRSPLNCAIVSVKDNFQTTNLPTTCASHILSGFQSTSNAFVVGRLRRMGALIISKTNMDEFGMGSHSTHSSIGLVKNGVQTGTARSVGGSSGGSALAVALGQCSVALGTDTGGSVRLPAAYTGIYGFKPSYGLLSRNGVVPYANSLDTVGIFARTRRMVHEVFVHLNIGDKDDPTCLTAQSRRRIKTLRSMRESKGKRRIGVPVEYNVHELHSSVREAWIRTLTLLERQGHEIVPVSLPSTKQALSAYYVLAPAEASSNLAKYDGVRYGARDAYDADDSGNPLFAQLRGSKFGDEVKRRILLGAYSLSADAIENYFIQAQKVRRLVQQDFDMIFRMKNPLHDRVEPSKEGVDLIVCPTAPTPPPQLYEVEHQDPLDAYVNDVFTVPASLAGLPALSIPAPLPPVDPPAHEQLIGMQIIGQYGDDNSVLELAAYVAHADTNKTKRTDVVERLNARKLR